MRIVHFLAVRAARITLLTSPASEPPAIVFPQSLSIYSVDGESLNFVDPSNQPILAFGTAGTIGDLLRANSLDLQTTNDWVLWQLDTFEKYDDAKEWKQANTDKPPLGTCANSIDVFLGGPCQFGGGTSVRRTVSGLPSWAAFIRITGRLHYFDRWDGESLVIKINGIEYFVKSHAWCPDGYQATCRQKQVNVCGAEEGDRLSEKFDITLVKAADQIEIEISDSLPPAEKSPCQASWAVDDVGIWLKT